MKETDIHKCLLSWGLFPMTLILKELEETEKYEQCKEILEAIDTFKNKYFVIPKEAETKWSEELQDEYYGLFTKRPELVKSNMEYYLRDIKKRLVL